MGMGIEIVSKINYNNLFPISNEESLNKFTEDHNINLKMKIKKKMKIKF